MGKGQVISIDSNLRQRQQSKAAHRDQSFVDAEDAFLYTIDLLMEDFGKKHLPQYCALCEPMKVMGKHRDAVMEALVYSLFTTFFPSFASYLSEVRDNLMQGLLERGERRSFSSLKEKLQALLRGQIQADLKDFFTDLRKHLMKYTGTPLEPEKEAEVLGRVLDRLFAQWIS